MSSPYTSDADELERSMPGPFSDALASLSPKDRLLVRGVSARMFGRCQPLQVVLSHGAILPTYGTAGAAAFDLYAPTNLPPTFLDRGQRRFIDTGVSMAIPDGYWGHVLGRSGLARKSGIDVLGGVIDSDYRGTIGVTLLNTGDDPLVIHSGERVAQMVILPCQRVQFVEVDALDGTERGAKGFGSTGR